MKVKSEGDMSVPKTGCDEAKRMGYGLYLTRISKESEYANFRMFIFSKFLNKFVYRIIL